MDAMHHRRARSAPAKKPAGTLQLGRIFGARAIAVAVGGTMLATGSAAVALTSPETRSQTLEVLAAWMPDGNLTPGNTDKGGDRKQGQLTVRTDDGHVYGLESGLVTPQGVIDFDSPRDVKQFDTGFFRAIYGIETQPADAGDTTYGLYASLGVINGFTTDTWHDLVLWGHGGHGRLSPSSSDMVPYLEISARMDQAFRLTELGDLGALDLNTAAFTRLGTMETSLGAGAFLSLNMGDTDTVSFQPNLPGMPLKAAKSTATIYGGVTARGIIYDRATDITGETYPLKLTTAFGAAITTGKSFTLGAEYQIDMSPDVYNGYADNKTVNKIIGFARLKF